MPSFDVRIQVYDGADTKQAQAMDVFQRALSDAVERLKGVPFLPSELATSTNGRVEMQRSISSPGNCTVVVHYTHVSAIHHSSVTRAAEQCIRGIASQAPGLLVRVLPATTDAEQRYEESPHSAPAVAAPLDSDSDDETDDDEVDPETTKSSSWLPYVAAGVAVGMAATFMSAEGDGEEDEAPLSAAAAAAAAAAGTP